VQLRAAPETDLPVGSGPRRAVGLIEMRVECAFDARLPLFVRHRFILSRIWRQDDLRTGAGRSSPDCWLNR
jgi:hypothetical protein